MSFLYFFYSNKKNSANIAKKRLSYVISEDGKNNLHINYLNNLKNDILIVVRKYLKVDSKTCNIEVNEKKNKSFYILEFNVKFFKKR
ncbi:cell division topological specificity factor MinE [Buchnera aphidicola (Chaitoregma tattakana)]|uniref:cell division topological specificity factor MinE n=1 Tax=Buchnera aphidicola TaxID=9 RepID=UPI0031B8AAA9